MKAAGDPEIVKTACDVPYLRGDDE